MPRGVRLIVAEALQAGVTRGAALKALRIMLADAGVDGFAADARLLLCAADGLSRADLIRDPERALSEAAVGRLAPMAARRAAREPLSRILARREFWGLPLTISPAVLDPRPDTETLVETVVGALADRREAPLRLVDLGVGSGAILCALLKEFGAATGVAVDLSAPAAAQARANLAACNVAGRATVLVGSWGKAVRGPFDVVVSNPPYVASGEIGDLQREVREHDPALALDGGLDGLDAYRAIGPELDGLLARDGRFFLEVGAEQADSVMAILRGNGLTGLATHADLAGVARVVSGRAGAGEEAKETGRGN
ncbi:MAG: peptide chain release factor N(5)-glutamine methyltransferase [Roseiarcus sp.]